MTPDQRAALRRVLHAACDSWPPDHPDLATLAPLLNAAAPQPTRPLTYLACPYLHPDRAVRVARFEAANHATGVLMAQGHKVFSPISHCHPIAEAHELPQGWDYWEAFDRAYLACSCRLVGSKYAPDATGILVTRPKLDDAKAEAERIVNAAGIGGAK